MSMSKIELWRTGDSPPDGWIKKEVYIEQVHKDKTICKYVILHYPDGTSIGGFEGYDDELPEGAVEMPRQDISAMFEEKVKRLHDVGG